jgi:hypothetical protein
MPAQGLGACDWYRCLADAGRDPPPARGCRQEAHEVLEAAPETIHRPNGNQVALAVPGGFAQPLKGGTLIAVLGAAHALVHELTDDDPGAGGHRAELGQLVVCGLLVRAGAYVAGDALPRLLEVLKTAGHR